MGKFLQMFLENTSGNDGSNQTSVVFDYHSPLNSEPIAVFKLMVPDFPSHEAPRRFPMFDDTEVEYSLPQAESLLAKRLLHTSRRWQEN